MDEAELRAELSVLHAKVDAARWFSIALATAAFQDDTIARMKATSRLYLFAAYVAATQSVHVGGLLKGAADTFAAFSERGATDKIITAALALYLDAGPEKRKALTTWLQTATPEETAVELQALVAKYAAQGKARPPTTSRQRRRRKPSKRG